MWFQAFHICVDMRVEVWGFWVPDGFGADIARRVIIDDGFKGHVGKVCLVADNPCQFGVQAGGDKRRAPAAALLTGIFASACLCTPAYDSP